MDDAGGMGTGAATLEIRPARPAELDEVGRLLVESFSAYAAALTPAVAATYLAEVAEVDRRVAVAEVLVATCEGVVVGSVTFVPDAGDDDHPWPEGGSVLRLLAVAPPWRGRGVGRLLVDACIRRALVRERRFLALHTAPFMQAATHLYERMGFVRAPEWDFDAGSHYGAGAPGAGQVRGLAYVLELAAR